MKRWPLAALAALCACFGSSRAAPDEELVEKRTGHSVQSRIREPTDALVAQLRLPAGFRVRRFADGLGRPRMLHVAGDGTVFVARPAAGDVLALRDVDRDGRADTTRTAVRLPDVHHVVTRDGTMYLVTVRTVYRAPLDAGGVGRPEKILDDLPPGGRHPNRTLGVGPDGALFVSVGSTCNCCVESHPEAASIVRFGSDGSGRRLFATGLRNTIGFDWHPVTREMWGMDHGTDWLGDDFPPEELNLLAEGRNYGWPFVYGQGRLPDAIRRPAGFDAASFLARATAPVLGYVAHAAPLQMVFYTGTQFPQPYRDDAFVAMHGSWNRKPPAGYEVVRVSFEAGRPVAIEPFLTGFLLSPDGETFGRPTGIAVGSDGGLLVGDDSTGVLYHISYGGEAAAGAR